MKAIKYTSLFSAGFFLGILWSYFAFMAMPQHRVAIALEACFTEEAPHDVTRLTWDVWASTPWRYSIGAPLYVQSKMTRQGALNRLCMYEQLDPKGFDEMIRGGL